MSAFDLEPDLAARLGEFVPEERVAGDWADVLGRVRPSRRHQMMAFRLVIVFAIFLILASVATATYLVLTRSGSGSGSRQPGQLTLIEPASGSIRNREGDLAAIGVVVHGGLRRVWQCPHRTWCGQLTAIAWSPDGRRLAIALGEVGGRSGYVGLHVIDLRTGADKHLGVPAIPDVEREQPVAVLMRLVRLSTRRLGCSLPDEVAWAPDSKRLAYVCGGFLNGGTRSAIYTINADGSDRKRLPTGTTTAYWPSWSPDGTRVAFSTEVHPGMTVRCCSTSSPLRYLANVYSVRINGSGRTLIARNAVAPSWSPDGTTIAYESSCGVKLASPAGQDKTPQFKANCSILAAKGPPAWSLDGTTIAVTTEAGGTQLVSSDGTRLRVATRQNGLGGYGGGRAAWAPTAAIQRLLERHPPRSSAAAAEDH
jgi:WD40-like Beta Propeller Repeat